jgi:type I restriction enzyme, R subunit
MSRIGEDDEGLKAKDIELMKSKRTVFIVDEAHRSTFGDMLYRIKGTFPQAIFFGFTGTPIHDENNKHDVTTADIFGSELHRYSIADGIRDKNVLGFDPYKVTTFKDLEIRKAVALHELKAESEADVMSDDTKRARYYEFIQKIPMAGYKDNGRYVKGIEDYVPNSQYDTDTHRLMVVEDITSNWVTISRNGRFHAIFATNSIKEAILYYRLFKEKAQHIKVVGLFDPNIDNNPNSEFKESGLIELLEDYNARYGMTYDAGSFQNYKKNVASRLAHKASYISIHKTPEKQIDLLIVVNQMLTGFDSKWINTLYVDKVLEFENIIQAFSRTNRLFGPEKPFGTIKYYRKPHTMERNIEIAIKSYSGDRPFSLFVPKLKDNVLEMNRIYHEIETLFKTNKDIDFSKLPEDESSKAKFAKLFKQLSEALEAAKIQGFHWEDVIEYEMQLDDAIEVALVETDYLILAQRYKELNNGPGPGPGGNEPIPYDIEGYLTEINTGLIDTNYMNTKFEKYLKALEIGKQEDIDLTLKELHSTFATLTQEEQKYAQVFLNDIYRGEVKITEGKTLKEYITSYQVQAKNDQIGRCAMVFGLGEEKLRHFLARKVSMDSINEFGRFDELLRTVDIKKAREYFEAIEQKKLSIPQVHIKIDEFLRHFIFEGGFEIKLEQLK